MTFFANRRRMLLGLATATAAAASGVTASGAAAPQESPELIALADHLDDALAAHLAAIAKVKSIAEKWGPHWPTPSEDIQRWTSGSKQYVDILGRPVQLPAPWKKGDKRVVNVGTAECFENDAARHRREYERKMNFKSQRGAKYEKQSMQKSAAAVAPARAFWAEVERIKYTSGIEPAQAEQKAALNALRDLVGRIVMFREQTITGLIIKAQAIETWSHVDDLDRAIAEFNRALADEPVNWGDELAATIIRRVGGTA